MKKEILKIKKSEMAAIKGGTSTTLIKQIGYAENEYEDVNGDGKLDEGDKYLGQWDIEWNRVKAIKGN